MLGVFFPLYASYGGSNQDNLGASVLPTLHTLSDAPVRSPLAEVDIDDVAKFLLSITSPAIVTRKNAEVNYIAYSKSSRIFANIFLLQL